MKTRFRTEQKDKFQPFCMELEFETKEDLENFKRVLMTAKHTAELNHNVTSVKAPGLMAEELLTKMKNHENN